MAFREVRVFEIREVLRLWLRGEGFRGWSGWRVWTARRSAVTWLPRRSWVCLATATRSSGVSGRWWRRFARTEVMVMVRRGGCWSLITSPSSSG